MTISIVIASYNYGQYLAQALDSVRNQTFRDWEALIVDDGSTDDSLRVAARYLADSRFRILELAHRGQSAAKNTGIAASRGEFIAFLDADDRWRPTKLQKQIGLMNRPEVGVVYSRRRLITPEGHISANDSRQLHRGNITNAMFHDNFVCFSSSLVRRSVFDRVGTFDEAIHLAIDFDLWLRASRICEFDFVDAPLVEYRVGHANLSRRVGERLETALKIMDRFRREIDKPRLLAPSVADAALADTLRHRGIVGRMEPGRGIRWLLKSLQVDPSDQRTWRALIAALTPFWMRRWRRQLIGMPDWEAALLPMAKKAA